jgi:GT2 family glycosyltransferase
MNSEGQSSDAEPLSATVVICAYTDERWDDIVASVESACRQSYAARDVVVVVDHNPDLLIRCKERFPNVLVIANAEPAGLAGARNTGVAHADTDVIAFLDDDAQAEPDWLARLMPPYADPDVLGVGGRVEPAWSGSRPRSMPPEFDWVVGCSYVGLPSATAPVRNLIGANMSLRRSVFAVVGGFAAGLGRVRSRPAGCEETELCIRARARHENGRFVYEPGAVVRHRVTLERQSWRYFRARCFAEGRSKAVVASLVGSGPALESEWDYVRHALPHGVGRGLREALAGDAAGFARAGRILAGLSITTAGYVTGSLTASRLRTTGPAMAPVLASGALITAATQVVTEEMS